MGNNSESDSSVAIIDARQWQNQFDLRTGAKSTETNEAILLLRRVLSEHPYPGDLDGGSNRWVTETALELVREYRPGFVLLTYAEQYFATRIASLSGAEKKRIMVDLCREVDNFLEQTGMTPVIIGRGGVMPTQGFIDISGLDGIGVSPHWSARYGGVHEPSESDLAWLQSHPHIHRVVAKTAYQQLFAEPCPEPELLSDYLLVAEPGYAFKGLGCTMRKPAMVPLAAPELPCSSPQPVSDLTGLRQVIDNGLQQGRPMALIILEGVGKEDFPWPYSLCANTLDWFSYEPSDAQLLAITSGRHRLHEYPPGYLFHLRELKINRYPLSGYFKALPGGTIGDDYPGRSIAVGNKSMAMHMVAGADLCIECFSRNHYNQGSLGVVHRHNKIDHLAERI